jgi:predicted DNA-binding protein (MmcQ/YjbR family)
VRGQPGYWYRPLAGRTRFLMNIEQLRKICLAFPGVTEQIQWQDNLLFKVGGKMFVVAALEPARLWLSLKADPEEFAQLIERQGIVPAPYLARAKWVAIESPETLPAAELAALLRKSYDLVVAKLPRAKRESLSAKTSVRKTVKKKRRPPRKRN